MIVYKLQDDGSFIAGDTESRITKYTSPTSINAHNARKNPAKIAANMIIHEIDLRRMGINSSVINGGTEEYDKRHWVVLNQVIENLNNSND